MEAVASILLILLNLALLTILLAAVMEVVLRLTRRRTLGRETWSSLLIGTGIVLVLVMTLALPA
jgi:hypothetical protein